MWNMGWRVERENKTHKPCLKYRVAPEVEEAVVEIAYEYPAYGQLRVSNELRKRGILVSSGGVRSIWKRHKSGNYQEKAQSFGRKGGS